MRILDKYLLLIVKYSKLCVYKERERGPQGQQVQRAHIANVANEYCIIVCALVPDFVPV